MSDDFGAPDHLFNSLSEAEHKSLARDLRSRQQKPPECIVCHTLIDHDKPRFTCPGSCHGLICIDCTGRQDYKDYNFDDGSGMAMEQCVTCRNAKPKRVPFGLGKYEGVFFVLPFMFMCVSVYDALVGAGITSDFLDAQHTDIHVGGCVLTAIACVFVLVVLFAHSFDRLQPWIDYATVKNNQLNAWIQPCTNFATIKFYAWIDYAEANAQNITGITNGGALNVIVWGVVTTVFAVLFVAALLLS